MPTSEAKTSIPAGRFGGLGPAGSAPSGSGDGQGGARRGLESAGSGLLGGEDQGGLCGPVRLARTEGAAAVQLDQLHSSTGPPAVSGGPYRGDTDRRVERPPHRAHPDPDQTPSARTTEARGGRPRRVGETTGGVVPRVAPELATSSPHADASLRVMRGALPQAGVSREGIRSGPLPQLNQDT